MNYATPKNEIIFDVPNQLINESLGFDFMPRATCYCSSNYDFIVKLIDIKPIERHIGESGGFRDSKTILSLLTGFRYDSIIPPIQVYNYDVPNGYLYNIKDGYHRFMLSIVAKFTHIPVTMCNTKPIDIFNL